MRTKHGNVRVSRNKLHVEISGTCSVHVSATRAINSSPVPRYLRPYVDHTVEVTAVLMTTTPHGVTPPAIQKHLVPKCNVLILPILVDTCLNLLNFWLYVVKFYVQNL